MKKIFSYAMTIAASIALVSCGGGEKKAEKAPAPEAPANEVVTESIEATTSATITNTTPVEEKLVYSEKPLVVNKVTCPRGSLVPYIELAKDGHKIIMDPENDVIRVHYTLKLKKANPEFQNANVEDIQFIHEYRQALIVALMDKDDDDVEVLSIHKIEDDNCIELKKLLQGNAGDTKEFIYQWSPSDLADVYNSSIAIKLFNSADKTVVQ